MPEEVKFTEDELKKFKTYNKIIKMFKINLEI